MKQLKVSAACGMVVAAVLCNLGPAGDDTETVAHAEGSATAEPVLMSRAAPLRAPKLLSEVSAPVTQAGPQAGAEAGLQRHDGAQAKVAPESTNTAMAPKVSATPDVVEGASDCPAGMAMVEGDYCSQIEQKCLRWLDEDTKMRCAEFAPTSNCQGKLTHKRFCIDQYEYPNKAGEKPVIMKTWFEARDTCASEGKRLCGDSEWTLACEGQERLPYPYGYARNADACNIDKPHPDVDEKAIANPVTRDAEVARLDQRDASGSREACVSPYGVHDMTGNVDEWVVNEAKTPFASGLKGGYWGPVRTRCRPMTTAHSESFQFYQIGFRCCGDVPRDGESKAPVSPQNLPTGTGAGESANGVGRPAASLTGS